MKLDRLNKVLGGMRATGVTQLLVTSPASVYYLTGYLVSPGERMLALYITDGGDVTLFANKLFALTPSSDLTIVEYDDTDDSAKVLSSVPRAGVLGVDKDFTCRFALPLMAMRRDITLTVASKAVDDARMLKTPEELALMRESSRLNDRIIDRAIASIREGVTEKGVAKVYEDACAELGGSGASFPALICFGINGAQPHHDTDQTIIKRGDSVILDVGAKKNGYCSDMTRTVFFGELSDEQRRVYELVERANATGRAAVKPGVLLRDVDRAARKVIEDAGYGAYFIHRTGHGIGLEVHEFPDVSANSDVPAQPGMVFSIEPGIYLPGKFGVRVEDLVAVTEDGCETLNEYTKEPRVIA